MIANSDNDTVTFFSFSRTQVSKTVPSGGRLPRAVAVDSQFAYVTNQSDGTVSVFDLTPTPWRTPSAWDRTFGPRPSRCFRLPRCRAHRRAQRRTRRQADSDESSRRTVHFYFANPDNTGGASSILASGNRIYLANQSGATVTTAAVSLMTFDQSNQVVLSTPLNLKVDVGARSLALDSTDGLLLTACEGDGQIVLTDLGNNTVAGRIDALRVSPSDAVDDHSDRLSASNFPSISSAAPSTTNAAATTMTLAMAISGTNLSNASSVLFIDPATVPSLTRGSGSSNRGNFGTSDPAITVTSIQSNAAATQLTVQVQIAPNTSPRTRVIRVLTPNGETALTGAPSLTIM